MLKQLCFVFFLSFSVLGFSQQWKQNNLNTKVSFIIKNFGVNVDGAFDSIKIETNFDSNNLKDSYVNAAVAVKSITTGMVSRDKHILKKAYFNADEFEFIQLKSTSIKRDENGTVMLFADLTIKGIVKQIKVPLTVLESDKQIKISANFIINRKEFQVGGGSFVLSKFVNVKVEFKGTK